jgi:uncharacterized phage protein (TIGR01671 family)
MNYEEQFGNAQDENDGFTKFIEDGGEVFELSIFANGDCEYKVMDIDAKLMQYTGLKDKNGKEIYEGDVVKFKLFESIGDVFGFVQWWKESAKFAVSRYKWITNDGRLIEGKHASGGFPMNQIRTDTFEIIGNIYENPDLAEDKNNG